MPTPLSISGNPPDIEQGILTSSKGSGPKQHGPIAVGSDLYAVVSEDQGAGDFQIQIWKSTDAGLSWNEMDAGNGPHFLGSYSSILDGTVIELVYNSLPPGLLRRTTYQEFDTATDTFSAANSAGAPVDPDNRDLIGDLHAARLSTGDYVVFYHGVLGAVSILLTGGVWQTPIQQFGDGNPTTTLELVGLTNGPSDTVYLEYVLTAAASPFLAQLITRSLTTGNVLSAASVVDSANAASNQYQRQGNLAAFNSTQVVPGISGGLPGIWVGTPLGAPVWTFVPSGPASPTPLAVFFLPTGASTGLIFWTTSDPAAINVWYAPYDGATVGDPVLFYDWNTDPPAGGGGVPGADQALKQPSIAVIGAGLGLLVAMAYNTPDEDYSTFFLPVEALDVLCGSPPDGIVGIAYSHFIPATGGLPPYTFTVTVGALPDGLTLNASTGEISGTPTVVDVFPFTIEVEDDDGATDDIECSITVVGDELEVTCDEPPIGIVATFYAHVFPVAGGVPPYSFMVVFGELPDGLVLDEDTGEVSGTPTVKGIFPFTIQVVDSLEAGGQVECSITIIKRCLLSEVQ